MTPFSLSFLVCKTDLKHTFQRVTMRIKWEKWHKCTPGAAWPHDAVENMSLEARWKSWNLVCATAHPWKSAGVTEVFWASSSSVKCQTTLNLKIYCKDEKTICNMPRVESISWVILIFFLSFFFLSLSLEDANQDNLLIWGFDWGGGRRNGYYEKKKRDATH